jgi:hypothetical protein
MVRYTGLSCGRSVVGSCRMFSGYPRDSSKTISTCNDAFTWMLTDLMLVEACFWLTGSRIEDMEVAASS